MNYVKWDTSSARVHVAVSLLVTNLVTGHHRGPGAGAGHQLGLTQGILKVVLKFLCASRSLQIILTLCFKEMSCDGLML